MSGFSWNEDDSKVLPAVAEVVELFLKKSFESSGEGCAVVEEVVVSGTLDPFLASLIFRINEGRKPWEVFINLNIVCFALVFKGEDLLVLNS